MEKRKIIKINTKRKSVKINKKKEYSEDNIDCEDAPAFYKMEKRKEKIHEEIFYYINKNMEKIESKLDSGTEDTLFVNSSKNLDDLNFENYSGEKISIMSFSNSDSKTRIIEKEKKSNNNSHHNIDKNNSTNSSKLFSKINTDSKNNKIGIKSNKKRLNLKTIVMSEKKSKTNIISAIDICPKDEFLIKNYNYRKSSEILQTDKFNEKNKEIKKNLFSDRKKTRPLTNIYNSPQLTEKNKQLNQNESSNKKSKQNLKEGKINLTSKNISLYESTSTSNTCEKNKNKFKFHESINNNNYLKKNEIELNNFFNEINLPLSYTNKFIENGFDDLNVILMSTKTLLAISNQNLKDIGIANASHRAKILIHLEEKAEIIPFNLEKDIIYNDNNKNFNDKCSEKLLNFFREIECERYLNNFKLNGYFNVELLLTQMITRQPINERILKEDFYVDDENMRKKIMKKLDTEARKYIKGLDKRNINQTIKYEDQTHRNYCEACLIF
jgi:hypothetical protein